MKNIHRRVLSILLIAGISCSLMPVRSSTRIRLVSAEIVVEGEVILRASTSDDGGPDADTVWAYLRTLQFSPTDSFDEALLNDGQTSLSLQGEALPGDRLARSIELTIRYGGQAFLRELELSHHSADHSGGVWRVEPTIVERAFDSRLITRREARLLENQKRKK